MKVLSEYVKRSDRLSLRKVGGIEYERGRCATVIDGTYGKSMWVEVKLLLDYTICSMRKIGAPRHTQRRPQFEGDHVTNPEFVPGSSEQFENHSAVESIGALLIQRSVSRVLVKH